MQENSYSNWCENLAEISLLSFLAIMLACLGVNAHGEAPAEDYAFVNVNVVPMDREIVLPRQTVLVSGGKIASITASSDTALAPEVE
ncbi:MAG: hypothetical protein RIC89_13825, partial [Pseudomonadales bacterium]